MSEVLKRLETGRVLSLFCDDVALARRQLRSAAEEGLSVPTLVALEWERAPSLARELDEIRDALAEAAASLWPDWYITAEQRFERTRSPDLDVSELIAELSATAAHPSSGWLREAWRACRDGRLPVVVPPMANAEQVRQLSRALDPSRLVFALSIAVDTGPPSRLRGLAHAAEWLARESQAKTLLLLPISAQGHPELDRVAYGALTLDRDESASMRPSGRPDIHSSQTPYTAVPPTNGCASSNGSATVQVLVGPIVGKPHPGSEVEQLLHGRLTADAELASLFEYNQRLTAFDDALYIVDLVWKQGGLVVELDGPEHHGHLAYVKDRERDYRLYMSGYTTLRVTNDEVGVDVERVVTKIRNMVGRLRLLTKEQSQ